MNDEVLKEALACLERGYSVVPIEPRGKKPPKNFQWKKYQESRATCEEVREWYDRYPDANLGIVTGEISGITVVDIDSENARQKVAAACGGLPMTRTNITPRGLHMIYRYEPSLSNSVNRAVKIDVRSDGGLIVAPPSVHESGVRYRASSEEGRGPLCALAVMPGELRALLAGERDLSARLESWITDMRPIKNHSRNDSLTRIAGSMAATGMSESELASSLWEINNRRCEEPLSIAEVESIARSIYGRERAKRAHTASQRLISRSLDDVEPEMVEWGWKKLCRTWRLDDLGWSSGFREKHPYDRSHCKGDNRQSDARRFARYEGRCVVT